MPPARLRLDQARRVALAAQGFGRPRPDSVTARHLQGVIDRVALFQIDSVNVLRRAHYVPAFSRLGPYDTALLDASASRPPRRTFEYWGHAASLIDVSLQPALRYRMARAADEAWGSMVRVQRDHPALVDRVLADIGASPAGLTARQIEHDEVVDRQDWGWNWSLVKSAVEWLFWSGQVTSAGRTKSFERVYDLPERVLPRTVLEAPTPEPAEAHRILVRRAARALGVATERDLADYFRTSRADTRQAVGDLVASGELLAVAVDGWRDRAWLWHEAAVPRQVSARALVCPFDSLVFERRRVARVFGVDFRLEFYVPAADRTYGYLVYLFVLGDGIVARVDLKADRASRRLVVPGAWLEAGQVADRVAPELAESLRDMVVWLGLDDVAVTPAGDLGSRLAREFV